MSCLVVVVVVAVFRGLCVYLGSFWDTFDVVCDDPAVDTPGLSDAAGVQPFCFHVREFSPRGPTWGACHACCRPGEGRSKRPLCKRMPGELVITETYYLEGATRV